MISTGKYDPHTDEFDLQGEIDLQVNRLKMQHLDIDATVLYLSSKREIYKAMIEYLLEKI